MRTAPALITAAALIAALAGCSAESSGGSLAGCDAPYESGSASSTVEATGDATAAPTVSFPTPLRTEDSQATTLVQGDGDLVEWGDQVDYGITILDGESGEELGSAGYDSDSLQRTAAGDSLYAQSEALACTHVGDRIALTATAAATYGEGSLSSYGIDDDDTLVFVIDILASYLGKADGVNQLPQDGMPTVTTAVDGTPGITIPAGESAPTEVRTSTIKAGGGEEISKGDQALLHFTAFSWPTESGGSPSKLVSTWDQMAAYGYTVDTSTLVPVSSSNGIELPEFARAVAASRVGSQLLIVAPVDDGSGTVTTYIFVVDVLGIVAAS